MASTIDKNYQKILQQAQSIYSVAPTQVPVPYLTSWYKRFTAPLKTMPFVILIPLAVASGLVVMTALGHLANQLTSLLQIAF